MFGPVMQFRVGDLLIRMSPLRREDMPAFVCNADEPGGMQCFVVTRYLGHRIAPVLEDEYEWFERTRADGDSISWGIYVKEDDGWKVIGNSVLNLIVGRPYTGAVSGFLIFDSQYWGKGIAKHCHMARTMFAFRQLNLTVIRSAVVDRNLGSARALEASGYVEVSRERNHSFVDGEWLHQRNYELVNPAPLQWDAWWHGDRPGDECLAARKRTEKAISWAVEHVELL